MEQNLQMDSTFLELLLEALGDPELTKQLEVYPEGKGQGVKFGVELKVTSINDMPLMPTTNPELTKVRQSYFHNN